MQHRRNDYDVTNRIQTTNPAAVEGEVLRLYRLLYPGETAKSISVAFADAASLYAGDFPGYRACDTGYHDLQHILDVTLAMVRLMDGYQRSRRAHSPVLAPDHFEFGIVAALFHDSGYIRAMDDHDAPSGAYYTQNHIARGIAFLRNYLPKIGMAAFAGEAVELLHFTGHEKRFADIPVQDPLTRLVGKLVGSADLVAQMADRCYLEKCRDRLYPEFVVGGVTTYRLPNGEDVALRSGDDLVRNTPNFVAEAIARLENELGGAYHYAATHFGGYNLYLHAANRNVQFAKRLFNNQDHLRRTLPMKAVSPAMLRSIPRAIPASLLHAKP
jgi:hypothetical protein